MFLMYVLARRSIYCNMSVHCSKFEPTIVSVQSPTAVKHAVDLLTNKYIVALPTDTVYGLACSAVDKEAIENLYAVKNRANQKPIAICVSNITNLRVWGRADHLNNDLLKSILPGPVTIVLNKSKNFYNSCFVSPGDKIGIRIPDSKFINRLCTSFPYPIALTSANKSNEMSSLNIDEFRDLWLQLGAVFDGGPLGTADNQRRASTVVDLSVPGRFEIIREGIAFEETLEKLTSHGLLSINNYN